MTALANEAAVGQPSLLTKARSPYVADDDDGIVDRSTKVISIGSIYF
jgi:hypothetical protein